MKTAAELFPGRVRLYVGEVARTWGMSEQEIVALVEAGRLGGAEIRDLESEAPRDIPRACLRIPVAAFDAFNTATKAGGESA